MGRAQARYASSNSYAILPSCAKISGNQASGGIGTDSNFLSTRVFYALGTAHSREIQPISANVGD